MKQTQLFAKVRHNGSLDEDANFMTFGHSILTLMRCATGEGWNDIMHAIIDAQDQVRISLFSSLTCSLFSVAACRSPVLSPPPLVRSCTLTPLHVYTIPTHSLPCIYLSLCHSVEVRSRSSVQCHRVRFHGANVQRGVYPH